MVDYAGIILSIITFLGENYAGIIGTFITIWQVLENLVQVNSKKMCRADRSKTYNTAWMVVDYLLSILYYSVNSQSCGHY